VTIQSLKEDGRPAQQWYWDTWFSSHDVQSCSMTAQGLWINMLGIMFVSEIRGTLTINGIQMDNKSIARRFRLPPKEVNKLITELESQQVFSRLEDGTIISRRMYRESKRKEELSRIRARAGRQGMQKRWKQTDNKNNKDDNKKITNITASSLTPTLTPTVTLKDKDKYIVAFKTFWDSWPSDRRQKKPYTEMKFLALCKKGDLERFRSACQNYADYLEYQQSENNFDQTPMLTSTWMNNWEEWVDRKGYKGAKL